MSDRLYTCDICIREGHEEVGCHKPNELIQAGDNVVCQGCLECGEFPELDDLPQSPFIPPEDKRIALLEAVAEAADIFYKHSTEATTARDYRLEAAQKAAGYRGRRE